MVLSTTVRNQPHCLFAYSVVLILLPMVYWPHCHQFPLLKKDLQLLTDGSPLGNFSSKWDSVLWDTVSREDQDQSNLTILCPGSYSSCWPPVPFPYRDLTRTLHFSKPLCSLGTLSPNRPWFFNCRIHSKSFSQTLESNVNQGIVLGICSMLLKISWWLRNLEYSKTIRRSICPICTEHPLIEQSQFCENWLEKQEFSLQCNYKRETVKTTKMSISIWTCGIGKTNCTYP